MKYIALLRGINISGKNKISMSELKLELEKNKYQNVSTYLNSGNVIFESDIDNKESIMKDIHKIIKNKFNLEIPVFIMTAFELEDILNNNPNWWGTDNKEIYDNLIFIIPPTKYENQAYNNYYAKLYSYQGDSLTVIESYNKGEDYLTTITRVVNSNQIQKITHYKKGNEQITLTEVDGKKYIQDSSRILNGQIIPVTYVSNGLLSNMQYAFFIGIDKTYCNGKECYIIKDESYERYIDKETGLAVRAIEKSNKEITRQTDIVVDYKYEFNTVKDSDIVKPDTLGYIVNE